MAPKEEGVQDAVLQYLGVQNRPYSTNDVFMNLHKEHGKPAIQRAIDQLVAEGRLKVKLNGKQTCYFVNQDDLPAASEEELEGLETQCKQVEEEGRGLGDQVKRQEDRLRKLASSLTTKEARDQMELVREENRGLEERLVRLENNQEVISAEDKARILTSHSTVVAMWRKRKRMAMEVLNSILESWPKSKQSLFEEAGVETDEEAGVKLPTK